MHETDICIIALGYWICGNYVLPLKHFQKIKSVNLFFLQWYANKLDREKCIMLWRVNFSYPVSIDYYINSHWFLLGIKWTVCLCGVSWLLAGQSIWTLMASPGKSSLLPYPIIQILVFSFSFFSAPTQLLILQLWLWE